MNRDDSWLPLFTLASHAAGDFPLQSDRMAAEKFDSRAVCAAHAGVYTAAFVPTVLVSGWDWKQSTRFLVMLAVSHYVIYSRRWAEPRDGFPTRPIWFDQSYHLIALAGCVAVADRTAGGADMSGRVTDEGTSTPDIAGILDHDRPGGGSDPDPDADAETETTES